jgi:hypothetical protein
MILELRKRTWFVTKKCIIYFCSFNDTITYIIYKLTNSLSGPGAEITGTHSASHFRQKYILRGIKKYSVAPVSWKISGPVRKGSLQGTIKKSISV